MDKQELIVALIDIIEDYLKQRGLDLVELVHRYEGRDLVLKIITDRPLGGITIGECASLNREIGDILESKAIIKDNYILEVSSPGLDRPLKIKNDYLRCLNRQIKVFLNEEVGSKTEIEGLLQKVEGESIYLLVENDVLEVPLSKINKGKQII